MFDIFHIGKSPKILNSIQVDSIQDAQDMSRTRFCWVLNYLCDYSDFDFLWEPKPWESSQCHAWNSQWQQDSETYLVPSIGYNGVNYHSGTITREVSKTNWEIPNNVDVDDFDFSWHPDTTEEPYIYQVGTQHQKTGGPRYVVPNATVVKYIGDQRVMALSDKTNWEIPNNVDVDDFDFSWHPDTTEEPYIYQVGTQHQKTGGPRYVVPNATVVKYIGEIKINHISISNENVYLIDHHNISNSENQVGKFFNNVVKTRFISSYMGTLKRIVGKVDSGYIWVTSSLCDYSNFDFSWHPEQWQSTMLHVFPSNEQKFGDTFLINVETFNDRIGNTEILEWYDTINFVSDMSIPRWDIPIVRYDSDDLVNEIKQYTFNDPFVKFIHTSVNDIDGGYTIPMWREKTRDVICLSDGNSVSIIPRDVKNHIDTQVYDYPYVSKKFVVGTDVQQDIVFISYDEIDADANWDILINRFPNAKRVHGVKGMDNALKKAALVSDTEWYYAVFAKTQVHSEFDFSFKPDRFQQPKHYIFNAKNMLNGLEYGHMGIVLYNSNIISGMTDEFGIDYTLSAQHEVVPLLSANATFNASPYQTWRTAFRECSKLAQFNHESGDLDSEYRLQIWTTTAKGEYAEWCIKGANDGVDYFNNNIGDNTSLKYAFNWEWLRDYFSSKYGYID